MKNEAYEKNYKETTEMLSVKLTNHLKEQGDPRELGTEMKWKGAPYYAEKDKTPKPSEESQKMFNLEEEYSYIGE